MIPSRLRIRAALGCGLLGLGLLGAGITGASAETVLIQGATVHTLGSKGIVEDTDILVADGVVKSLGTGLRVPDGARVIEANGRPVTPGLWAGISAIGTAEVSGVEQSVDSTNALESMHPEFDVSLAYNPHSTLVPVARVEGHTFTTLGTGMGGSIIGGQGRVVALDGGYDSFHGGYVLYINLGRGASSRTGGSRAVQWLLLNQAVEETVRAPARGEEALLTRAGRQTLERYANGGTVVFTVNRASDILQTLQFAEDHDIVPVIYGGAEAWMVAEQLAAAEAPVILNPLQNLPGNFDSLGARLDNAALLHARGVTVAFGAGESHNARKLRQMAGNAASHGLPKEAALAALTINPARIFGVARTFGSLEEGKRADLVLWSGDPLEVTTVADLVIVAGEVDSMESRQTKLRDRYLVVDPELPRAYTQP
ncbi:MAG: amidohydrolase family protein [Xanthomonadales bacterium]|jgi:hypothetical protein|nr:amidohydrolase family protein [Xanthomonadales bacterium]